MKTKPTLLRTAMMAVALSLATLSALAQPNATTTGATSVTPASATLNGTVWSDYASAAWFEWGTTTNYGNATQTTDLTGGYGIPVSAGLSNLLAGTVYHYRLLAANEWGVGAGSDVAFRTPLFTELDAGLAGVTCGSVAWGDFDNDGKLDILLMGYADSGDGSWVYHSNGDGTFTNIDAGLIGNQQSAAAWGDYNSDGNLDILLPGYGYWDSRVYRNNGDSTFVDISASLPAASQGGSVAWGDFDNDGKLDILLAGATGTGLGAAVYHNNGNGTFTDIGAGLPGVYYASVACADYNNDGYLDILLTGYSGHALLANVYRNNGDGTFTDIGAGLPGIYYGSAAWGDFDNDGMPDILLTGMTNGFDAIARIYRNNGDGTFTDINADLPPLCNSSVAWGDFDNDGKPDLLLTGSTNAYYSGSISRLYRNNGDGTFTDITDINAALPGVSYSAVACADYDNDGTLDILLTGTTNGNNSGRLSRLYRNYAVSNTPPSAPAGLTVTMSGTNVVFHWNAAADNETPAAGLTYNLRIGTTPDGCDVMSPQAAANGWRRLPARGNAQQRLSLTARIPLGQTYYWSVQAVDPASAGSPFADEAVSWVPNLPGASTLPSSDVVLAGFRARATLNGAVNPGGDDAVGWFEWGTSTNYGSTTMATNLGSGTNDIAVSVMVADLAPNVTYFYRLAASNNVGRVFGTDMGFQTPPAPPYVLTQPATSIAATSAVFHGTANANGSATVVWFELGMTTNYFDTIGYTNLGSGTNEVSLGAAVAGLQPATTYHYRLAANNAGGNAYAADEVFATPAVPPTATTQPATGMSSTGATLNGLANPNGTPTAAWFQWGTTTNYGNATTPTNVGSGQIGRPVGAPLGGLSPATLYHFRLVATNSAGTNCGQDLNFTSFSTNANLAALTLSSGPFAPLFAPAVTNYNASVSNASFGVYVTPTSADANATIRVRANGGTFSDVVSGLASGLLVLNDGGNSIDVQVTAQDLTTMKTYTLAVTLYIHAADVDGFDPNVNNSVSAIAVQADGKIIIMGDFTTVGGTSRSKIARLNVDGSPDAPFNPGLGPYGATLAVQTDGRIVVGGNFTNLAGQARNHIGRLNSDGSLDPDFNPGADGSIYSRLHCLAVQADGKILVGGLFSTLGGQPRQNLGRLNTNGSPDTAFNPGAGGNYVNSLAVQADGRILVGGAFTTLGGQPRNNLGRLHSDGSLDTDFNPVVSNVVSCIVVQADGKILVGGSFGIARLNADGSLDTTFAPGVNGGVSGLALQADGKILVGGGFTSVAGQPCANIARLHADGSLDSDFNPGANGSVYGLAIQPNGRILVGGSFTSLGGQPRNRIGRLTSGGAAVQVLGVNGSTATLGRSGSGPEIEQVTFEYSADGTNFSLLGNGTRINGGWRLGGLSLPLRQAFYLRTRGRATGGYRNASSGLTELVQQCYFAPNSNADLSGLALSACPFEPAFQPTVTAYDAMLTNRVVAVIATSADPNATVQLRINGGAYTPFASGGQSSPLSLMSGDNPIDFQLTSSDGTTTKTYTLTIKRVDPPIAVTLAASDVTPSNATLHGVMNPNGLETTAWFEWGMTTNHGQTTPVTPIGNGLSDVAISNGLAGLAPGTTYYYRSVASNWTAVVFGADQSFTTLGPPVVTTLPALRAGPTTEILDGFVKPKGLETSAWFEWGTTTNYGYATPLTNLGNGWSDQSISSTLTGLTERATYHFRAAGSNSAALIYGADRSFVAGSWSVTTVSDTGPGSLRQTIADAYPGAFIDFAISGTITSTNGELVIAKDLNLIGPGATNLSISGRRGRVFTISSNVTVTISGLTIRDGHAPSGSSGTNGTHGTSATPESDATDGGNGGPGGAGEHGGGIYNAGILTLTDCIVSDNAAGRGGWGGLGGQGGHDSWQYRYRCAGTGGSGGCGGDGGDGGGIFNTGTLTLSGCTVSGNAAGDGGSGGSGGGGGDYGGNAGSGNSAGRSGHGGGLCNLGNIALHNCTFKGNRAGDAADGGTGGDGGHKYAEHDIDWGANGCGGSGGDGGCGGGLYNGPPTHTLTPTLILNSCTVTGNFATTNGAGGRPGSAPLGESSPGIAGAPGICGSGGGVANLALARPGNSIVALNSTPPPSCINSADVVGMFSSDGYNLIGQGDGSRGFTNGVNADLVGSAFAPLDPVLGPLQDNGGPTPTIALLPASPAIDKGKSFGLTTDQRGLARTVDFAAYPNASGGDGSDIGAVEVQTRGAPWLTVTRSNNAVIVSWPLPAEGWVLECTTVLPQLSVPWPQIPPPYQTNGVSLQFTEPLPTGNKFYRLHKP